mmetsp:Transcript_92351/g.260887  ORF Transcript_92351/g.260887 Transcript_92351/m.260887 type:complete len:451 (-) Transcript_92351:6-1358(-)
MADESGIAPHPTKASGDTDDACPEGDEWLGLLDKCEAVEGRSSRERQETLESDLEAVSARRAVKAVLFGIGLASGSVPSSYFACVGFFATRLDSKELGGYQFLVYQSSLVLVLTLQQFFDDAYDAAYGVRQAFGFRIIVPGFVQAVLGFIMVTASASWQVVLAGIIIAICSTSQWSSAAQLGSVLVSGGGTYVGAGLTLGSALAVVLVPVVGFSPEASLARALVFCGIGSAICALGTFLFLVLHLAVQGGTLQSVGIQRRSASGRLTLGYQTMSEHQASGASRGNSSVNFVMLFCAFNLVMTFAPLPLFPLAGSDMSQRLILTKLAGDGLGRLVALGQASQYGRYTPVRSSVVWFITAVCSMRLVPIAYILIWLESSESTRPSLAEPFWLCLICLIFFSIGSYVDGMFNLAVQLAVPEAERKSATRFNVFLACCGSVAGTMFGATIVHWR